MEVLEQCILGLMGLSGGLLVAAGVFAFTVMTGVVSRMVARTRTIKYLWIYEDCIVVGGTLGSLCSLYHPDLPGGGALLLAYGLFSGIFVGGLAIALAEAVNAIPVMAHRIRLKQGSAVIVLVFAIGKALGAIWQLIFSQN